MKKKFDLIINFKKIDKGFEKLGDYCVCSDIEFDVTFKFFDVKCHYDINLQSNETRNTIVKNALILTDVASLVDHCDSYSFEFVERV